MISAGIVVADPDFRKQIFESLQNLGVRIEFAVEDTSRSGLVASI